MLFVDDTVIKFCQFCLIPALGSTYEVTCDALKFVDTIVTALGAYLQLGLSILIAAVHTAIAVVVAAANLL